MHKQTVLIVGEVFVDTHLDIIENNSPVLRLGGIFHSARALSAVYVNYALAYYAPDYLDDDINYWSCFLKTKGCYKLGSINKAPNVMLVNESKEAGHQGYCNILKDQAEYIELNSINTIIQAVCPTDILIFPGRYNCGRILNDIQDYKGKIHIDFHYDYENIVCSLKRKIDTIILSTSSKFFKEDCEGKKEKILDFFKSYPINAFLIKENRGGSYCLSLKENKEYEAPAYYVPTMHSVGVGDVYNSIFISIFSKLDIASTMLLASLCAAKYAETMSYEKFSANVKNILTNFEELKDLKGIRLPWQNRKNIDIYLAAPDFPDVNTQLLGDLYDCLLYHNFNPHLPIKENGLSSCVLSQEEELELYQKDVLLLDKCKLLIAVLLYNDPGTLVELGMFRAAKKPTIIFDPYNLCQNMFVKHTPNYLCKTISDVIEKVYICSEENLNEKF